MASGNEWDLLMVPLEDIPIQGAIAFVPVKGKRRNSSGRAVPEGVSPAYAEAVKAERRIGKRGRIREFSDDSRRRLKRFLHRVRWDNRGVIFVTLTFSGYPTPPEAKKNLHRLLTWLQGRYPGVTYVWKMEYQKRGSIHFHLVLAWPALARGRVPWIDKQELAKAWGRGFVDVRFVPGRRILGYVAKYVGKPAESIRAGGGPCVSEGSAGAGGESGRLDKMPISAGEGGIADSGKADEGVFRWPGRFWGRSESWRFAPVIKAGMLPEGQFLQFRLAIRQFLEWLSLQEEIWGGVYQVILNIPTSVGECFV